MRALEFSRVKGTANVERRPILFSKGIESAYKYFVRQDVSPGPINTDSGDNRFFEFQVPQGNTIEVCTEPR